MTSDNPAAPPGAVRAAGVVAFRSGREVLLVHRPRYDDWSFPKGKLDRGEHPTAAAVREAAEETGLRVRLGPPLARQHYLLSGPQRGRTKTVDYWTARVVGRDDVSGYRPNDEIDQVRWLPLDEAARLLSYDHDRRTLREATKLRRRTHAVVVLRHAEARSRSAWREDDRLRPLLKAGTVTASRLLPLLASYDVSRVVSSPSTRCVQTVAPYAEAHGIGLETRRALSEEDVSEKGVRKVAEKLLDDDRGSVLCTHRPVLPVVYDALGLARAQRGDELGKGEMLVLHVRKGDVVSVERHRAR